MPTATKEESFALMDRFVAQGGNFIVRDHLELPCLMPTIDFVEKDTADIYGLGTSESIIGSWLQNRPSGFREK